MDDRRCIKEIQNGHKEYLNDIAEKYYNDIYHFCCYQTGSTQDSYDLAQEVFFRFIRYVDNYRYRNLKGYLLTIAANVCRDYFRRCTVDKEHTYPVSVYEEQTGCKPSALIEGESLRSDNRQAICSALLKLPDKTRDR